MDLQQAFNELREKHYKVIEQAEHNARVAEQIRMLQVVRNMMRDETISKDAAEILALEIGMGFEHE